MCLQMEAWGIELSLPTILWECIGNIQPIRWIIDGANGISNGLEIDHQMYMLMYNDVALSIYMYIPYMIIILYHRIWGYNGDIWYTIGI